MGVEGRPVSVSEVVFARTMTQLDANLLGNVHGGVIMREVDMAAGAAASRHAGKVAVTAAIDELSFYEPVHVGDILTVRARVNGVGRTSMEIGVRVEVEPWTGGESRHTTSAYLVMVALDTNGNPSEVPPLICENEDERRREAQAEIRRAQRKERLSKISAWQDES